MQQKPFTLSKGNVSKELLEAIEGLTQLFNYVYESK